MLVFVSLHQSYISDGHISKCNKMVHYGSITKCKYDLSVYCQTSPFQSKNYWKVFCNITTHMTGIVLSMLQELTWGSSALESDYRKTNDRFQIGGCTYINKYYTTCWNLSISATLFPIPSLRPLPIPEFISSSVCNITSYIAILRSIDNHHVRSSITLSREDIWFSILK